MVKKLISLLALTILIVANTQLAFAEDPEEDVDNTGPDELTEFLDELVPTGEDLFGRSENNENGEVSFAEGDLEQEIAPRALRIFTQFSGLIAFVIFVYASIRLIVSRNNEEELKRAKDTLIYAAIGATIVAGSFGIIVGLLRLFDNIGV